MTENSNQTPIHTEPKWLKVSLSEWLDRRNDFLSKSVNEKLALALVISSEDELKITADDLKEIKMVIIEFATLIDGRGFSFAAILREKFGFQGGVRAANVLEDNVAYLEECGFDSFELESGKIYYSHPQDQNNLDHSPIGFSQRLNRVNFS